MPRLRVLVVACAVSVTALGLASPAYADEALTVTAPTDPVVGSSYQPAVTGGSDGTAATLTVPTTDSCSLDNDAVTVHFAHAGDCTVNAQKGTDETGTVTFTIGQAPQVITFAPLSGGALGSSEQLSATSDSGLDVTFSAVDDTCSVSGTTVTYDHAGLCTVAADQPGSADYLAADQQTRSVTIAKADQTIDFPQPANGVAGGTAALAATASSTLPVTFTSTTTDVCTVSGTTVTFVHAQPCTIAADQDGNSDYASAPEVTQTITVAQGDQTVDLRTVIADATVGATATLPTTTVQGNAVRLNAFSGACTIDAAGTAVTFAHTGSCQVYAEATGNDDYTELQGKLPVFDVAKGASTVAVSVTSTDVTATVGQKQGSDADLTPGSVIFSLDGKQIGDPVEVSGTTATLPYTVPTGATHTVTAAYSGSNDLTDSTSDYHRSDPSITVSKVSSSVAPKNGWYRKPVTVTFTCTKTSGAISSCTKPVTLVASGKQRAVTGKAVAADGGVSSLITHVNIDAVAPKVKVTGPVNGAVYVGTAPKAKCVGSDTLSGLASCAVRVAPRANGVFSYAASAVDKAGNTTRITGSYRVMNRYLRGAIFDGGSNSYLVQAGSTVTLVALAPSRPRYYQPVFYNGTPHVAGHTFFHDGRQAGSPRWSLTVTLPSSMRAHKFWNLGIKVGRTLYKVKVRVTG